MSKKTDIQMKNEESSVSKNNHSCFGINNFLYLFIKAIYYFNSWLNSDVCFVWLSALLQLLLKDTQTLVCVRHKFIDQFGAL